MQTAFSYCILSKTKKSAGIFLFIYYIISFRFKKNVTNSFLFHQIQVYCFEIVTFTSAKINLKKIWHRIISYRFNNIISYPRIVAPFTRALSQKNQTRLKTWYIISLGQKQTQHSPSYPKELLYPHQHMPVKQPVYTIDKLSHHSK